MTDDPDGPDQLSALMQVTLLTMEGREALVQGDGVRALDILSRKHKQLLEVFAKDSAFAGTSFVDLAEALHLLGNQKEARQAINAALAIFNRVDRHDDMRNRLERVLIDVCRRQGHAFVVEELLRVRTTSGGNSSSEDDLRRATEQDELAMMFFRRREYDKALKLLLNSKDVFEQAGVSAHADLAVCCQFLARVYLHTERYHESVTCGRQAAEYAAQAHGESSLELTMVRDELAVALAFFARQNDDAAIAHEAIALSECSIRRFTAQQGRDSKEAARSLDNNRRLKHMLRPLLASASQSYDGDSLVFPTFCFISHAYSDKGALTALLKALPKYVKAVVLRPLMRHLQT